MAKVVSSYIFL